MVRMGFVELYNNTFRDLLADFGDKDGGGSGNAFGRRSGSGGPRDFGSSLRSSRMMTAASVAARRVILTCGSSAPESTSVNHLQGASIWSGVRRFACIFATPRTHYDSLQRATGRGQRRRPTSTSTVRGRTPF